MKGGGTGMGGKGKQSDTGTDVVRYINVWGEGGVCVRASVRAWCYVCRSCTFQLDRLFADRMFFRHLFKGRMKDKKKTTH